jgi:hypothetical protein
MYLINSHISHKYFVRYQNKCKEIRYFHIDDWDEACARYNNGIGV